MSISNSFSVSNFADMYYGGYSPSAPGQKVVVTGTEAIKNVIKMYLMSQKGDYGRDVTRGGPLFNIIGKQVSNTTQQKIYDTVASAVATFDSIIITTLEVIKVERGWAIKIVFTDTTNKFVDSLNLSITEASQR